MTLNEKIPVTVLTGFLGAGKTTLVQHLIRNAGGTRFGFIVNEFGDLGIDRELIRGCGVEGCEDDDIVELANGCICCTVADDFLPAMLGLVDRDEPPEHIVIETSGLALPKPLVKAFTWPEVRTRVTVDGVIAVVDGPAVAEGTFADDPDAVQTQREETPELDHENPLEEVFEEQLLCADMIVVNKSDLLDRTSAAQVRAILDSARRQTTRVVSATRGEIDPLVVLGIGAAAEDDLDQRPSHHDGVDDDHDHDEFDSFSLQLERVDDPAQLESMLKDIVAQHEILRVKGFVEVTGSPMRHVFQGVGGRIVRYFDRPWLTGESRRGTIVFIGLKGMNRDTIARELGGIRP